MDPKQTLLDASRALLECNRSQVRDLLYAYWRFRAFGGFEPVIRGPIDSIPGDALAMTIRANIRVRNKNNFSAVLSGELF